MEMPRLMARVNKRVFNPMELKRGKRPVLRHVGRKSGSRFRTPLDAFPTDNGYLFILVYGTRSDWVQNILTSGSAVLELEGNEIPLVNPAVVDRETAEKLVSDSVELPVSFMNIPQCLAMDRDATQEDGSSRTAAGTDTAQG